MSILSGSIASRRYAIVNNADTASNPTNVLHALQNNAFPPDWAGAGVKLGWVQLDDLLGVDFGANDWNVSPFYVFSLRMDTRQVPAPLLRAHLNKALDKWRMENGKRRVPRNVRNELRDSVTNELLPTVTPRSKMFDVTWDTRTNTISFAGLSDVVAEHFVALFSESFNCTIEAEELVVAEESRNFYLWLWYHAVHETLSDDRSNTNFARRIALSDESGEETTTVVGAEGRAAECRKAASLGKRPTSLRLVTTVGTVDNTFQLQNSQLFLSGLKMKLQDGEEDKADTKDQADRDRVATILDRAEMLVEVLAALRGWVRQYENCRDSDWEQWFREECTPWLEGV